MILVQPFREAMLAKLGRLPSLNTLEGRPYAVVARIALDALGAAVDRGDHERARLVLSVLLPLRCVFAKRPLPICPDHEAAIYLLGVGLTIGGIVHDGLQPAIAAIDQQLPEDVRAKACDWANQECKAVRDAYFNDEATGCLVAKALLTRLCRHEGAVKAALIDKAWAEHEGRKLVEAWNQKKAEDADSEPAATAGVDPNWVRIVATKTTTAISFGNGFGSAAIVNGRLSLLFKR